MLQASFFWKNNQPDGIGFTFGPPSFSPTELKMMFEGEPIKRFFRDSDAALGSNIVHTMLSQLAGVSSARRLGDPIPMKFMVMTAFNIMWLTSRGFIPNDEFNGYQFVSTLPMEEPKKKDPV